MRLTIERLGHLGDGIAAGPVFVPGALPGEEVEGDVVDGRIGAPRIVTPSPARVRPACPHYRACGGCSLMHATDGFVADWKASVVRTALQGHGLPADMRPTITSPERSRRRAVLAGRRTKKAVLVGFHGRASGTIVSIPDCRLLCPELLATLPALEEVTAQGASRNGELALGITLTGGGVELAVSGGKTMEPALFTALADIATRAGLARLTWDGAVVVAAHPATQRFGKALVIPPPGGFLQATAAGEAALVGAVRTAIGSARRVADLFAGAGTFALAMAETAEVHAVEGDAPALAALDAGWRKTPGLHRVTTEARDLFRRPLLADELAGFDALVVDPPRAGCEAQVRQIAGSPAPVVAMVSCNPVTFARDAHILVQSGYALDWVQVVDQFRWSPHIEVVARLSRPFTRP